MSWLGDPWGLYALPRERQVELLALWEMEVEGKRPKPPPKSDDIKVPSDRFRVA